MTALVNSPRRWARIGQLKSSLLHAIAEAFQGCAFHLLKPSSQLALCARRASKRDSRRGSGSKLPCQQVIGGAVRSTVDESLASRPSRNTASVQKQAKAPIRLSPLSGQPRSECSAGHRHYDCRVSSPEIQGKMEKPRTRSRLHHLPTTNPKNREEMGVE